MGLRVAIVTLMLGLSLAFQSTRGESAPTFTALIVFTYTITDGHGHTATATVHIFVRIIQ